MCEFCGCLSVVFTTIGIRESQIIICFTLLTGSKKGNSHIIQSVKVMKVNGSIISLSMNHNSQHLAVGSDQGYVNSLFPFFFVPSLYSCLITFTVFWWLFSGYHNEFTRHGLILDHFTIKLTSCEA